MFKIGDFSKLAQVSVKTLRYYAQLGLLEPVWVDRYSGYRYYKLEQLPRLNRILALKDLGFSLEQIQGMLREDLAASELRGMLRLKQAELERQVQDEQMRLKRIQARMRQIEQEGRLPAYDVVLKQIAPQRVAGIREVIPDISQVPGLFARLQGALGRPQTGFGHHERTVSDLLRRRLPRTGYRRGGGAAGFQEHAGWQAAGAT